MPPLSFAARVAPSTVVGSRGPENAASGNIIPDVQPGLVRYVNKVSPFTTLTMGSQAPEKRNTTNYNFKWLEKDYLPPFIELAASATAGATTVTVATDHWKRTSNGFIFRHPVSKERIRVSADPTTTTVTVTRAWGGTTATSYVSGDRFYLAGLAYEDGQDTPRALHTIEVLKDGNTQIFRTALKLTGRSLNTDFYGGDDWENEKLEKKLEHMRAIELAGLYGVKDSQTGTEHLITTTDGLESKIASNVWALNLADVSWALVCDFAITGMRWGKGGYYNGGTREKYMFCPAVLLNKFAEVFHDKVWNSNGEKEVIEGVTVRKIVTPMGDINLIHDPLLDEISAIQGGTTADAFLVDINHVLCRVHQGRDTKLLDNRQGNGLDARIAEYFSDLGFQIELEDAHSKLEITL